MFGTYLPALLTYLEPVLCCCVLFAMWRARALRAFLPLAILITTRLIDDAFCLGILSFSARHIDARRAYDLYFYTYWSLFGMEGALSLYVIYGIFRLAMEPLKGLQTLGTLVFRWAGAISIALAAFMAFTPHESGLKFFMAIATQFQRTSSVLTLCLLTFVCFAIRPMGLSFKSRIFGVSLGLGLTASMNLITAAWFSRSPEMLKSVVSLMSGSVGILTLLIWSAYFTLPEPKRRIIVLPTTSPFLRWNQISEVLGDEPGYVAIAGVPPEIFAPAEIEIMRRASLMMNTESAPPPELATPASLKSLSA